MSEAEGLPETAPSGPRWHALDRRGRVRRGLAAAVVVFHLGCTMYTMAPSGDWRAPFDTVLRYYTQFLRMTTRWDMFGAAPDVAMVFVEGKLDNGEIVPLADPFVRGWAFVQRVIDGRLRKFHQKLKKRSHRRRWGALYLDYLCRAAADDHPDLREAVLVRVDPRTVDDDGLEKSREQRRDLLRHRCGSEASGETDDDLWRRQRQRREAQADEERE